MPSLHDVNSKICRRYNRILNETSELDGSVSKERILNMVVEIIKNKGLPDDKASRWLGFIQGVMVMEGLLDIDDERNETRTLFHEYYKSKNITVPKTFDFSGKIPEKIVVKLKPTMRCHTDDTHQTLSNIKKFSDINFPMIDEIIDLTASNCQFLYEITSNEERIAQMPNLIGNYVISEHKDGLPALAELYWDVWLSLCHHRYSETTSLDPSVTKNFLILKEKLEYSILPSGYDIYYYIGKNPEWNQRFLDIVKTGFNNELVFLLEESCDMGKYAYISPMVSFSVEEASV